MPVLNKSFNTLVRFMGSLVPHDLTIGQYKDFAEMKADYDARGRIRVNVENSTNTIFGTPTINWQFRAWHDMCHILTGADFSRDGELAACREMQRQIDALPDYTRVEKEEFKRIVWIEVMGQYEYYQQEGKYPDNQYEFFINDGEAYAAFAEGQLRYDYA
jgi:hypothetical protein